jgi:hypothetical protein
MFGHRFFGAAYFGPSYFGPDVGGGSPPAPSGDNLYRKAFGSLHRMMTP